MKRDRMTLAKIGVAQVAGFVALSLATPAQAADDPPPATPRVAPVSAAVTGTPPAEPPDQQADTTAAGNEEPANTNLAASATTQQADPSRLPTRVISMAPAQKSPDRAGSEGGWHQVPVRVWFAAQYHAEAMRYHALRASRSRSPGTHETGLHFSPRISSKREVIRLPKCQQKLAWNVLQISERECLGGASDLPVLAALAHKSGTCRTPGTQYQPAGRQYQGSPDLSCRPSAAPSRPSVGAHPPEPRAAPQAQAAHSAQGPGDDSLLESASVSLLAGFAVVLLAAAITVAPPLRSRIQSKGLSYRLANGTTRGGIRYRE
jgi:hypothetical protein